MYLNGFFFLVHLFPFRKGLVGELGKARQQIGASSLTEASGGNEMKAPPPDSL